MGRRLGPMKQPWLEKVKNVPVTKEKLLEALATFEDLEFDDLVGYVNPKILEELKPKPPVPPDEKEWEEILAMPLGTNDQIDQIIRRIQSFLSKFPQSMHVNEANDQFVQLQKKKQDLINAEKEIHDWENLDRGNYSALLTYRAKYPNSVHLEELDDLMWKNTLAVMGSHALNRYLSDWPLGLHAAEAHNIIGRLGEWEEVKRSGDIFRVDDYRDNNPDSPFITEVNALYYKLRDEELAKMKESPSDYVKDELEQFLNAGIFTKWELIDEGLMTEESWKKLQLNREVFPNIQDYQTANPDLEANPDCTDIYLFGTPGTGKTCLLMGLAGADGHGYTLNMKTEGGPYASALQQYLNAGITPGRTYGSFVTTIHGLVNDEVRGRYVTHPINLVEMSGEEFALRIADNQQVSLADMGTGATNLLRNENRKVFFIIVDSTKDNVTINYIEQVHDADGNIIEDRMRKRYISQLDILNKFVSLFSLPENQDIMQHVDAIHFIVTKADMLGEYSSRKGKARELLLQKYRGPVQNLKTFCHQSQRINAVTSYTPQVFTFSLGKFYLGDVFDFDKQETLDILDAIRAITKGKSEKGFWGKFKDFFG